MCDWVSDDGQWAAVVGSDTGLPVGELSVVEQAMNENKQRPPSPPPDAGATDRANPNAGRPPREDRDGELPAIKPGFAEAKTTLDEGPVVIRWPNDLSADSVADLEHFLAGLMKRAKRKAGALAPAKLDDD